MWRTHPFVWRSSSRSSKWMEESSVWWRRKIIKTSRPTWLLINHDNKTWAAACIEGSIKLSEFFRRKPPWNLLGLDCDTLQHHQHCRWISTIILEGDNEYQCCDLYTSKKLGILLFLQKNGIPDFWVDYVDSEDEDLAIINVVKVAIKSYVVDWAKTHISDTKQMESSKLQRAYWLIKTTEEMVNIGNHKRWIDVENVKILTKSTTIAQKATKRKFFSKRLPRPVKSFNSTKEHSSLVGWRYCNCPSEDTKISQHSSLQSWKVDKLR